MLMRSEFTTEHRVSHWETIHLFTESVAKRICLHCGPYQMPIVQLAKFFVKDVLQLDISTVNSPYEVIQFALNYYREGTTHEKLYELLSQNVGPVVLHQIKDLMERLIIESRSPLTNDTIVTPGTSTLFVSNGITGKQRVQVVSNLPNYFQVPAIVLLLYLILVRRQHS
jgi:tyrosine-protein phosphatase YwqE